MRVLMIESQEKMAELLSRGLQEEGHTVDVALRAEDALRLAGAARYDVIVLDLMLSAPGGLETRRRLREQQVKTPVLILTAGDEVEDQPADLDADTYVVRPFTFSELLARLPALR